MAYTPIPSGVGGGEILTVGASAVTNFALAPTSWTLNGDADGEYLITGMIVLPNNSAAFSYMLQPTATGANQTGQVVIGNNTTIQGSNVANLFIGSGVTNGGRLTFQAKFTAKTGRVRTWTCSSDSRDPTAPSTVSRLSVGEWNDTSTVVDATTQIHCDNANGIGAASWFKIVRTLITA